MEELKDTVSAAGHRSQVWIGLYSHVDWKWSDGFNQSGDEYRNWNDHQPNYNEANQFCVGMTRQGTWFDYYCHVKPTFVCYNDSAAGGFEFVRVNTRKTWSEAQKHCREHFTDLATVRNDDENEEIKSLISRGNWAWIGLYRDSQIYWSDGSHFSFSSWSPGVNSPDSMEVGCGVADLNKGGKWRLISCEVRKPFVCYSMEQRGWCFQ
ncbi:macrophage mannose receptor 1-like [Limanda limanda]|uniref:macrophage mannose receptor 1-like n=1 Tax=Limanda limanda TaxID=27771 RepID=UPI0029C9912F|nr:macrophage mannose receptor 1-like [Limanda limanda]